MGLLWPQTQAQHSLGASSLFILGTAQAPTSAHLIPCCPPLHPSRLPQAQPSASKGLHWEEAVVLEVMDLEKMLVWYKSV